MASPPKPWETSGGATSASVGLAGSNTAATSSSNPPPLPEIPNALSSVANRNASNYSNMNSTMNTNRYQSPYSSYGSGYNSYSSPYSRMGGMGGYGSMYGGGMGGMYGGGMGMGMGMGGMYGNGMGMPGDPNNMSLTQSFSQSTQTTFQLIEGIVGAFGGFAQMLESTYMATHSSFFAMVSVAEQFGNLRQTLGSVLGIFTLMRWIRTAIAKLTGRPLPASGKDLTPTNFAAFNGVAPDGSPIAKPSKKPFVVFMLAAFGLPYLMGKLIKALARSQEEEEKRRMAENPHMAAEPIDPNKLEFCRVLYDFTPDANANAVQGLDLAVKKGDMVAVLSKSDPLGNPSEWWRCRSRDGRMGYLPGVYLEVIQRRAPVAQITSGSQASGSPAGSRAQTMTSSSAASRTATLTAEKSKMMEKAPPAVSGKAGDMGVESFQKGAFYS